MKNVLKIESVKCGTKFQLPPWWTEGANLLNVLKIGETSSVKSEKQNVNEEKSRNSIFILVLIFTLIF